MSTDTCGRTFDLESAWELHPQVSIRPERFGALVYHFGTRRLSFLKSTMLLSVVKSLADHPSCRIAFAASGVPDSEIPRYSGALATLAESGIICPRKMS